MPTIQMHYDGWLTLPEAARHKLGVATGDRLEVEFTGNTVVLRPARRAGAAERAPVQAEPAEPMTAEPVEVAPEPTPPAVPSPVVKRGPGRPRKAPVAALPQGLKTRGRRKAVPAVETQTH